MRCPSSGPPRREGRLGPPGMSPGSTGPTASCWTPCVAIVSEDIETRIGLM